MILGGKGKKDLPLIWNFLIAFQLLFVKYEAEVVIWLKIWTHQANLAKFDHWKMTAGEAVTVENGGSDCTATTIASIWVLIIMDGSLKL